MTRSFASTRRVRSTPQPAAAPRDPTPCGPTIDRLGFRCFRLVAVDDPDPGEAAWASIQLMRTTNTMGVFARRARAAQSGLH